MNETLRPMSLGEILDRAVQMLKGNLVLFAGIAAVPALASLVYSLATDSIRRLGSEHLLGGRIALIGLAVISWLGFVILSPMAAGAKCWATSCVLLGRPVTIGSSYGAFMNRKGRLFGLGFMQGILSGWPAIFGCLIVGALISGFHVNVTSPLYLVLICLAFVPCLPMYARYLLAYPATAIADMTVSDSLKRSIELGRNYRWKVFWSFALPAGIGLVLISGSAAVLEFAGHWLHVQLLHPLLFSVLDGMVTFVVSLFYEPLTSIALTLTYYDMCVRKEGLDIVQMMAQAGLEPVLPDAELA